MTQHNNGEKMDDTDSDEEIEFVDADFSDPDGERSDELEFGFPSRDLKLAEPATVSLVVQRFDTGSDKTAKLCCSECGEQLKISGNGYAIDDVSCGCEDTPKRWEAETADSS